MPAATLTIPASWDAAAAMRALQELRSDGEAKAPIYDIGSSRVIGERTVRGCGATVVVAKGMFAAELIETLGGRKALAGAWCIRDKPWLNCGKRLGRNLRQRRQPPKHCGAEAIN